MERVYRNLPLVRGSNGNLGVATNSTNPYSYSSQSKSIDPLLLERIRACNRASSDENDKFRLIGGSLAVHCAVDLEQRKVTDVGSMATAFRGYESLLVQRDLSEAGRISSTSSGICGGVHATASALTLEMAFGVKPPPLGIVARNLLLSCQYLDDNPMHLFVLSGPDYSEGTIRKTNPEIWAKAENAPAKHSAIHGYETVGALMKELNPPNGKLYRESFQMVSRARQAYALLGGKYPHSESFVPGGVILKELNEEKLDRFMEKLAPFLDYAKRSIAVWDEVFDFLYEADPRFLELGETNPTMVDFGQWDHDEYYDASYENCDAWGEKRWSTPGAIVDGELRTTRLTELNVGLEDFVDHSFYDHAGQNECETDPCGNAISPYHPWNKRLTRRPDKDHGAYSWATTTTWDRRTFEVGAYARLYITALAKKLPASRHLESTGQGLIFHLADDQLPAMDLTWQVPPRWNAFERNRARAYAIAFNLTVTLENWERAKSLISNGNSETATPFEVQGDGKKLGAGFCGAGRGFLGHWGQVRDGVLSNYQIAMPSRINVGPRSPWGELGGCEDALLNSPIIESSFRNEAEFHGIDLVRAIQSFDPCMVTSAHFVLNNGSHVIEREITTDEP